MNNKIIFSLIFVFLIANAFIANANANLVVDPAKLGILRLQLYPMSPAVAIREFRIGNTYDEPMKIELTAIEDMEGLITISESNFTIEPNGEKIVEYTVTIDKPGYYDGAILVKASREGKSTIGYKADLAVFVRESNLQPYFYIIIITIVIVMALIFALVFRKTTKKSKKLRK